MMRTKAQNNHPDTFVFFVFPLFSFPGGRWP